MVIFILIYFYFVKIELTSALSTDKLLNMFTYYLILLDNFFLLND